MNPRWWNMSEDDKMPEGWYFVAKQKPKPKVVGFAYVALTKNGTHLLCPGPRDSLYETEIDSEHVKKGVNLWGPLSVKDKDCWRMRDGKMPEGWYLGGDDETIDSIYKMIYIGEHKSGELRSCFGCTAKSLILGCPVKLCTGYVFGPMSQPNYD